MPAFRHWYRTARRRPRDALVLLFLVAGAVAADAVVFQAVDRLVLRPLPLPDAHRLLVLGSSMPAIGREARSFEAFSGPELDGLDRGLSDLGSVLTFDLDSVRMLGGDLPARLFLGFAWNDPVPVLGAPPLLGRSLNAEELDRGLPSILLSHAAWRREFAEDPEVVGRSVNLDDRPHTIVGVLPPHIGVYGVDAWVPMPGDRRDLEADRRQFNALLRVHDDVEPRRVSERLEALAPRMGRALAVRAPEYDGWRLTAVPLPRELGYAWADEAALTGAGTVLVLLLVAANLAGLATLRGLRDRRATATRLALGVGPARLRREALTDAAVTAGAGAVVGLVAAAGGMEVLASALPGSLLPAGRPLALETSGIAAGLAAALAAALALGGGGLAGRAGVTAREAMAPGGASPYTPGHRRMHGLLVTAQVALGIVLGTGALAATRTAARLLAVDPGFDADRVAYMRISLPAEAYAGDAVAAFFDRAVAAARALPGVEAAGLASQVLPSTRFSARIERREGDGQAAADRAYHTVVGGAYFATHGIDLVEGRPLDDRDRVGAPGAAVVNEAAARAYFPGGTAVGEELRVHGTNFDSGWLEVVGVSRDVRHRGAHLPAEPEVFTAHAQAGDRYRQMFVVLRSSGDPLDAVPAMRARIQELDPAQPLYSVGTPGAVLDAQTAPRRVAAGLLSLFAAVAVLLGALALHAALGLAFSARRGELALRAAVGAGPGALRGELARQGLRLFLPGAVSGVAVALWSGAVLGPRLGLGSGSGTVAPAFAALLVVSLAAGSAAVPSLRRAGRAAPADALRSGG